MSFLALNPVKSRSRPLGNARPLDVHASWIGPPASVSAQALWIASLPEIASDKGEYHGGIDFAARTAETISAPEN